LAEEAKGAAPLADPELPLGRLTDRGCCCCCCCPASEAGTPGRLPPLDVLVARPALPDPLLAETDATVTAVGAGSGITPAVAALAVAGGAEGRGISCPPRRPDALRFSAEAEEEGPCAPGCCACACCCALL
jgi:hypothetical protein